MIADVVGFSRLMEADEAGALGALNTRWKEVLDPMAREQGGRIVKFMGDGVLVEFASVINAVAGALAFQRGMAELNEGLPEDRQMHFRVGVNFGDVIGEGADIYGDGVNIAARLEPLAAPGGICVSGKVREEVEGKLDCVFADQGEQTLKNISRPIRVWRVATAGEEAAAAPLLSLPDRPSIAVVPFQNMSADPEQDYFADGMVEDIITELSRFKGLFVISRNSSFAYKAAQIDIKRVGRELGVRYVLEGSVRKAGARLRITGQLIDAATGVHLWADRFDGALEDVFELQDQVTARVVGAIAPRVEAAEIERAARKPTGSLDALDHYLRGLAGFNRFCPEGNRAALEAFTSAIALDPGYAAALGMAARTYVQRMGFAWTDELPVDRERAVRLARAAAAHGPDDGVALAAAGFTLIFFDEVADGDAYLEQAVDLCPNLAWGWHISGFAKALMGEIDHVVERARRALRLSPQDPQAFAMQSVVALGQLLTGREEEALATALSAQRLRPHFLTAACIAAVSAARLGREAEAARALATVREISPALRVSTLSEIWAFQRETERALWAEGLRKAGLPE
ncbi:adenylate/guanylate cyclase domain-containing protein [Pikeienuella piscinae]|uniref:Adenylate/guanylate cyclase domain-containing protein n=1 Tax=Pikeienuella piscinae TaxID=2748098 RepID=A0A7M3T6U7_9RHOB|nr:adenylate/guanylate cyclase domain-containing protein [Pikeienuella piscinae]